MALLFLGLRLDPLLGDKGLENACVSVLRVTKVQDLVQQLVDEHKVVLDVLLADLAKVGLHHLTHLEQELKDHGGVDILPGHCRQPDVGPLDVEEGCPRYVGHGTAHLLSGMDHIHPERVHRIAPAWKNVPLATPPNDAITTLLRGCIKVHRWADIYDINGTKEEGQ